MKRHPRDDCTRARSVGPVTMPEVLLRRVLLDIKLILESSALTAVLQVLSCLAQVRPLWTDGIAILTIVRAGGVSRGQTCIHRPRCNDASRMD